MRRFDHFEPLLRAQLVGAEHLAHRVDQNLGGRAGQTSESLGAQQREVVPQAHAQRIGAVPNLERREGMHVHRRIRGFHRAQDLEIGLPREARMDAALQANLGRSALARLERAAHDLRGVEQIPPLRALVLAGALREGAERAAVAAHVGVVDVAVDDISRDVAVGLGAQLVGGLAYQPKVAAAGIEQARRAHPRAGTPHRDPSAHRASRRSRRRCGAGAPREKPGGSSALRPVRHESSRPRRAPSLSSRTAGRIAGSSQIALALA